MTTHVNAQAAAAMQAPHPNPRLRAMLEAPIFQTVLKLAWPNLLMMVAQSSTGLVETWFVSRLGTGALAGMALVLPVLMLMQNMSGGAMGGGISSAISRALGARRAEQADALVRNAVLINALIGIVFSALLLLGGSRLYRAMGGSGASLDAALAYSNVIFAGIVLMWVMNALASAIRGAGNMLVPGAVICGGALCLVPLSPCLIFGVGPFPRLGVAGAGCALLIYYAASCAILGWYCWSGRNAARLRRGRWEWPLMRDILQVGGVAVLNPLMTNALVALTTAILGARAGVAAVAGYGTGVRLEYLVMPVAFGIGAPMVALVGSNMGAGQPERARRIALTGGAIAFVVAEAIGVAAAIWPVAWMSLFGTQPEMIAVGSRYLRICGPFYGFFGMGFSLYFASQGARRLKWPLLAGLIRLVLAVGVGGLVLGVTGSLTAFFISSAVGMVVYGITVVTSIALPSGFVSNAKGKPA